MLNSSDSERRAAVVGVDSAGGRWVKGYAIVFNRLSEDLGGFREVIEPSAVDRIFEEDIDVRALVNHDTALVLGRRSSGTLVLTKDSHGLLAAIDLPKTSAGQDIHELVSRRDVSGMSFTFSVVKPAGETWEQRGGLTVRVIRDARIPEVSIVAFPAYNMTDVQVAKRSLEQFRAQPATVHSIESHRRKLRIGI